MSSLLVLPPSSNLRSVRGTFSSRARPDMLLSSSFRSSKVAVGSVRPSEVGWLVPFLFLPSESEGRKGASNEMCACVTGCDREGRRGRGRASDCAT